MVISRFEERRFSDEVQSTRSSNDDGYVHDDGHVPQIDKDCAWAGSESVPAYFFRKETQL